MREITMKRNSILTIMVLGALLTLAGCSSDSPTSPPASPTPTAFSISLTASPTEAVVNSSIVVAARVTSGGQNVADGTSVTFSITGCVPSSATTPHFENGTCEMVRTTQAGTATAVIGSQVDGAFEVKARVPNAVAALVVRFVQPTDPQTLALYSIIPTRGPATGGQQVIVRGRGFAKPLVVEFVVGNGAFTAQIVGVNAAGTELTAITPPVNPETATAEQTANLRVTAAAGTDAQVQVTMTGAYVFEKKFTDPRIYQIVPDRGITTGGEPVTIYGANFVEPVKVVFGNEDAQVLSVTSDGSQVRVLTPRHSGQATTVDVTVYTRYGTAQQQSVVRASAFTWVPPVIDPGAPVIYGVIPDRGSARGGEEVTILGANLCGQVVSTTGECYSLPTVEFQIGAPVNATRAAEVLGGAPDGRSLRVRTPEATPGPLTADAVAAVIVTNAAGSYTATGAFTYLHETLDPQLFLVQPNRGSPRGGEEVRLIGRNFTAPVQVEFIIGAPLSVTYPAQVLSVSGDGTEIVIVTPQASPNPVTTDVNVAIRITTMVGSGNSRTGTFNNAFTYVGEARPPIIYYLDPDKGSREGREEVTIYGRYFIRPVRVTFVGVGDAEVTDVAADGTTITILTPPARITLPADGKVDVTVVSEAGTGRDQQVTLADGFQYREAESPEIYSLAPNSGPIEGGTRVTINGRGFQYPVQVMFNVMGSDRQAQVVSVNYTTVVCISPSITATQPTTPIIAQVRVVNALTGQASNSLPFRYGDAMFISAIAPASGPDLGGQRVTIFGQGFVAPVAVTIAGVAAQVLSVSGTEIVVLTGAPVDRSCSNRTGTVVVTNINSGISATGPTYTYTPARPLITRVEVVKQGVNTGTNVVQQHDPLGIAACNDANHPPYNQYEVIVYGENFERRPNSTNSAMSVIFENPSVEVLTTWVSPTEIRFQLPDLSQVQMATAACTSGGAVGTRDIPTGLPFTVKNNNNNCEDRLNPALILEPCDPTCRVGTIQVDLTPNQLTLGVGTNAVMTVCINAIQATPTQVIISQSGPSGVVNFDPDGPGPQPAAPAITVTIPAGSACTTFYVNGLTGGGPVAVTATLPVSLGGATDTSQVTVGALGILLTPENLNLPVGGNGALTIQLSSPAPAGGAQVTVQLAGPAGVIDLDWAGDPGDPPNDSTFTITIPAGSSTYAFTCEGLTAGGPVTVTATLAPGLGGASDSSTVFVGQYTVTLSPEDLLLAPGGVGNFTVTLDSPAPPGGLTVTITQTGLSGVISTPASVFIAAGTQQATFQVNALAAGGPIVVTVTLPSSVGGASDSSTVTVAAYTVTLAPSSMNLNVGQTGNFTVTLNRPASPAAITVTLTQTGPSGIISLPATVTIPLNDTTATFQVTALAQGGPVTITASLPPSLNAPPSSATVTVGPMTISANPASLTVPVGGTGTFILVLSTPAPANINVTATSGNTGVATVTPPAAPHFTAGTTTTAAFTVTGVALGTTTIYCQLPAAYGGGTAQVAVTVANYQLTAIPTSLTVTPGGSGTFILQLNQPAPAGGAAITLASSNPQVATLGVGSITIPAGSTQSAPVTVTGGNIGSATITATLPAAMGGSAANVQVTVANYTLTAVPTSLVVTPGGTGTFVAQLNIPAPAGGLTVTAQSNNTLVATVAPASLTIAGGGTVTGNFTVTGVTAGTTTITLSLPAAVGGATATVNVTVATYSLTAVPTTLTVPWNGWQTVIFQLNQAAPAGGLVVNLATSDNRVAYPTLTQPPAAAAASVTINAGSLTSPAVYIYGNNIGNATIYGQLAVGGSTASVAVAVENPLRFVPASLTLPVGSIGTFTLQMAAALAAPTIIQLDYSGTNGAVAGPAAVTLPANSTTVTFNVFGVKPTTTPVSIVATLPDPLPFGLGGATATGTVTVTGAPYTLTITPNPVTLSINGTVTMTASFNYPLPPASFNVLTYPFVLPLTMSPPGSTVLQINGAGPGDDSVSFAAGDTSKTFTITGVTNGGPITITGTGPAALGGPVGTAVATVGPGTATLTLSPNPFMWQASAPAPTITISISPVQGTPTIVQLQSSNPSVVTVPPTVTIPAGLSSAPFTPTVVGTGNATITATPPWEPASPVRAAAAALASQASVTIFDATVSPAALTIPAGTTGTLTINLTNPLPAALTGVTITAPAYVSVPSPVTIPAGVTSYNVPVSAVQPGTGGTITVTLPGSAGGQALAPTPTVTVTAITFTLTAASSTVYVGTSTTATVTTATPVPADTTVTVADYGGTGDLDVPAAGTVVIPAGGTTVTFPVTGAALGTRTLSAALPPSLATGNQTFSMTIANLPLDLTPEGPVTVYKGTTQTMTVAIPAARNADTTVTLALDGASTGSATFPATVTIPAGSTSASFVATPGTSGTAIVRATLPATLNASAAPHDSETLTITDLPLTLTPATMNLAPSQTGTMTASIPVALAAPATVTLVNNGGGGVFTIPTSVTIPAGATSADFTVTALAATGSGTVEGSLPATLNALATPHATATVTVSALPLVMSPDTVGSLMAGGGQIFTITIPTAQATPTTVQLTSSAPSVVSVPASVVIPAGQTSVTFTAVGESMSGAATTITATLPPALGSGSDTSTITAVTRLTLAAQPANLQIAAATDALITVTTGVTLAKNVTVQLFSAEPTRVALFNAAGTGGIASIVIPSGGNSGQFRVRGLSPTGSLADPAVDVNLELDAALGGAAGPEAKLDVLVLALQLDFTPSVTAVNLTGTATITAQLLLPPGTFSVAFPVTVNLSPDAASGGALCDPTPAWTYAYAQQCTVVIPTGASSATFTVYGAAPGGPQVITGTLDAVLGGGTATMEVGVNATPGPSITGVSPAGGPTTGGTNVTITGSNFGAGASVTFDGIPATNVTVVNSTTITCTTPAHPAGQVTVAVQNLGGQTGTYYPFTYYAPPTLTSLSPNYDDTAGGVLVTITGANFTPGGTYVVDFGGSVVSGTAASATQITCNAPAHTAGTVTVTVIDGAGQSAQLVNAFSYYATPIITTLNPTVGDTAGGTQVTINGLFLAGGSYTVTFDPGGTAATCAVTSVTGSAIVCQTSAHAAGIVDVQVVDQAAQSATKTNAFTYHAPPTVTSITPAAGSTAGGTTVTINGSFTASAAYTVVFDPTGVPAPCTGAFANPGGTAITCATTAHPAALNVNVEVSDGVPSHAPATLFNAFSYYPPPVLTSVTPNTGSPAGGDTVQLNGAFLAGGSYTVTFDPLGTPAACAVTSVTATVITCTTGAHAAGTVAVRVQDGASATTTLASAFTYVAPISVTSIQNPLYSNQALGKAAGGEVVLINGSFPAGAAPYTVTFGANPAVAATWVSATQLQATTPANASGQFVDVVVTDSTSNTGSIAGANDFAYYNTFTLTSVSPNTGSSAGGTTVSIAVSAGDFTDTAVAGYTVSFDPTGTPAACAVSTVANTQLICTTSAHVLGPVAVRVTDATGQTSTLASAYTYTTTVTVSLSGGVNGDTSFGIFIDPVASVGAGCQYDGGSPPGVMAAGTYSCPSYTFSSAPLGGFGATASLANTTNTQYSFSGSACGTCAPNSSCTGITLGTADPQTCTITFSP